MARWLWLLVSVAGCVDLSLPARLTQGHDGGADAERDTGGAPGSTDTAPQPDAADPADAPPAGDAEIDTVDQPDSPPLIANGKACSADGQCQSSQCVEGLCCNSRCGTACSSCAVPGSEGTCSPVPAGQARAGDCVQDPAATCARDGTCDGAGNCRTYPAGTECAPPSCAGSTEYAASACDGSGHCMAGSSRSCAPNVCMGSSCGASCTKSTDCQSGFFCDSGACAVNHAVGATCASSEQCASHYCVDGVCCSTPCTEGCFACNLAGKLGTCAAVPSGQDPGNDCAQELAATCGRAGSCNGSGGCLLYPAGTTCTPASCSVNNATAPGTCNGLGTCRPGATTSCGVYLCNGGACPTSCNVPGDCQSGFTCQNNFCVVSNLLLRWALDESSGTTASDASGNGLDGTYIGSTGIPAPSASVSPSMKFPDPQSRLFVASKRQAVQLANMPAALRPSNNLTVSAWYRATGVDPDTSSGSDIVSGGDQYVLRVRATQIEFSKRIAGNTYAQCIVTANNHLDGNWHHLAGVTNSSGTHLYFDGVERCATSMGDSIAYDRGTDLFVGRHGFNQTQWDFDGNIDDVRVYGRALSASEVAYLAAGNR
jgi:hypothetical protein